MWGEVQAGRDYVGQFCVVYSMHNPPSSSIADIVLSTSSLQRCIEVLSVYEDRRTSQTNLQGNQSLSQMLSHGWMLLTYNFDESTAPSKGLT
jgi:hypothetical protein